MKIFSDPKRLRFAIPSKGRLREPTLNLLQKAGYAFRAKDRSLYASATNADIVFIFVRPDDIPVLVASGVVDLGITGQDLVLERKTKLSEVLALGFGECRLCVAVAEESSFKKASDLDGKGVATSFPVLSETFFQLQKTSARLIEMNGSVEVMIGLGLAEAIVDIVETGDSLKDNQLRILAEIGSYRTSLFASPEKISDPRIVQVRRRLEGVLIAQKWSMLEYNIPRAKLADAERIAPGFNSPTISELEDKN
ncbi:MAG: ATP phosphoribosyltransferase, partial [Spirochaetia bacterium]|nr:ATP phosphoribosyltransferase [Spirochaetia bacterium]